METRIALASLLRRFPVLRLTVEPDEIVWRGTPSLRGVEALPLATS
jgi:cytochrome P450